MRSEGAAARSMAGGIWTGDKFLVWGGWGARNPLTGFPTTLDTGDVYDPVQDAWTDLVQTNPPAPRRDHQVLWMAPNQMLIWGGVGESEFLTDGAVLNVETGAWRAIPANGATGRIFTSLAWTGSELIVWGGVERDSRVPSSSGALFDFKTARWRQMSDLGSPGPQLGPAVWTGSEFIVWGGTLEFGQAGGGAYDPVTDQWRSVSTAGAPPLLGGVALWTGDRVIAWGGDSDCPVGGIYDPVTDSWEPTTLQGARSQGTRFRAVWTGSEMLVFGGNVHPSILLHDGNRFRPPEIKE